MGDEWFCTCSVVAGLVVGHNWIAVRDADQDASRARGGLDGQRSTQHPFRSRRGEAARPSAIPSAFPSIHNADSGHSHAWAGAALQAPSWGAASASCGCSTGRCRPPVTSQHRDSSVQCTCSVPCRTCPKPSAHACASDPSMTQCAGVSDEAVASLKYRPPPPPPPPPPPHPTLLLESIDLAGAGPQPGPGSFHRRHRHGLGQQAAGR